MRLLRVISSTNPEGGGPIEGIKQFNAPLRELGVEVEIASCDAPSSPWVCDYELPTHHALGPSLGNYCYTPRLIPWLREHASAYDAVIVHGLWQYPGLAVRQVLARTKTPYFIFTHGMLDPWFKYKYPLKHLKKWLYWPWAEYRVLRDARAVIFTSEEERLLARESFALYRANEAVTAYGTSDAPKNSIELVTQFLTQYPGLKGKRVVLFLGRIHEKKGCDILIDAFASVAQKDERLHLVIAGPNKDGWAATLRDRAERSGVGHRLTWPGMLKGALKWGAFYASEVFCLPSHQENFGIAVTEALACGKPVLISNKVNIWREIEADGAGFVGDDTVEGTIANLERWLAMNQADFLAMKECSISSFTNRFHVKRATERFLEIVTNKQREPVRDPHV